MSTHFSRAVLLGLCLFVAGCSLPRGAAIEEEITRAKNAADANFAVEAVNRANVEQMKRWPVTGWSGQYQWFAASRGSLAPRIQTGDSLNLTIWDNEPNSLLTGLGQKQTEVQHLQVSQSGEVFVPYVGQVYVRGMTPTEARMAVQDKLSDIANSAQVQLHLVSGPSNTVDLIGGVAKPGRYPLPDRNQSLLSLLAEGGGVDKTLRNPIVRLIRDGRSYEIPAADLFDDASKNVALRGKDQIVVVKDDRYFTALGATGSERIVYFEQSQLTALEALSLLGGINDGRANPKGVLILREYPASALRSDGSGPRKQQTIFSLDLTSADGLFAARNFQIHPMDTVLATESPVNALRTILGLIGTTVGISNAAS